MEIYTFPVTWIYCRHIELLHLEFGGVDLDICRLLVGVYLHTTSFVQGHGKG